MKQAARIALTAMAIAATVLVAASSMERDLRPGNDAVADWVLFIECTDLGEVALALHP